MGGIELTLFLDFHAFSDSIQIFFVAGKLLLLFSLLMLLVPSYRRVWPMICRSCCRSRFNIRRVCLNVGRSFVVFGMVGDKT